MRYSKLNLPPSRHRRLPWCNAKVGDGGACADGRSECSFRCNFFTLPLAVVALLSRNVVIAAVGRIVVSERRAVEPSGCVSLAPPAARVSLSIRHHHWTCIKSVGGLNQFFIVGYVRPLREPAPVLQQSVFGRQPEQCQGRGGSCHQVVIC